MSELVKYHNYLNALQFKGFTATDYNLLMFLCAEMRDQEENKMVFSFSEIREVIQARKCSVDEFVKILESMNDKLIKVNAKIREGNKIIAFVLFPTYEIDPDTRTLTVGVNEQFRFILNELTKNFTQFELQEFVELNSKYSKVLYRLLKQYRSVGEYHVKVDELRKLLGSPESYTNKQLMQFVIMPAVKELQKDFLLLNCETTRARIKGRPVTAYHFSFDVDGQIPGQLTLDQGSEEMKRYKEQKDKEKKDKEKKKNTFTDFQQREIDFDALERSLIQKEINLVERGKEHEKITVHGELSD